MHSLKEKIRHSFNNSAQTYESAAFLQQEVAHRMMDNLELFKLNPKRILDLGSGTGSARKLLKKKFPRIEFVELDISFEMLSYSMNKYRDWSFWPFQPKNHFICADIESLPLKDSSIDFVWSNLVFEWGESVPRIIENVKRVLRPGGLLMFATLGPDTLKELRLSFERIGITPPINEFLDMHEIGDQLIQNGLLDPVMDAEILTLQFSSLSDFVSELKRSGSTTKSVTEVERAPWSRVEKAYPKNEGEDGIYPASFEVIYGHAWAPSTNPNPKISTIKFYDSK